MFQSFNAWRRLRCRRWWKVALMVFVVNTLVLLMRRALGTSPVTRPRVIGFYCKDFRACGGWADRQKAIVNAYVMAAMLGVEFKIYITMPCPLDFFLAPRDVNWRLEPGELEGKSVSWLGTSYVDHDFAMRFVNSDDPFKMFPATDYVFTASSVQLVEYLRQSRLASRLPWLKELTVPEIHRHVLAHLFSLMPGPQLVLDVFRQSLPPHTKLVCAQIRMGGDWDTEYFNSMDQFTGLASFLLPYNNTDTHRIMFTSDTPAMLQLARGRFPTVSVDIKGPVKHVDRAAGTDACGGFGHAIIEQLALSTCDVLVISESGLGKIAAFIRNTDKDLYLFHDGLVEPFLRENSFPNRVSW